MPLFRATVWYCSGSTLIEEGYKPTRYIAEMLAEDEQDFKTFIKNSHRNGYVTDINADVVIGPVSEKKSNDN